MLALANCRAFACTFLLHNVANLAIHNTATNCPFTTGFRPHQAASKCSRDRLLDVHNARAILYRIYSSTSIRVEFPFTLVTLLLEIRLRRELTMRARVLIRILSHAGGIIGHFEMQSPRFILSLHSYLICKLSLTVGGGMKR